MEKLHDLAAAHEAKALVKILHKIKPVMNYIDGPITTREAWITSDDVKIRDDAHYKEPGIVLVNNFSSTRRPDDPAWLDYIGYKVIFTRSGKIIQLERSGGWCEQHGKQSFWSSETSEISISPEFAKKHFKECLASIMNVTENAIARTKDKRSILRRRLSLLKKVESILK